MEKENNMATETISLQATGDPIDSLWYDCTTTVATDASIISSNYYQIINPEPNEVDIFKQITSLLGIKIVNVSIKDGKVVLYGRRNKRKFVIEVTNRMVIVKGENGDIISEIFLAPDYNQGGTITITPTPPAQPYIYPYPGTTSPNTTPNIWYTTDSSGTCSSTNTNIYGKTYV